MKVLLSIKPEFVTEIISGRKRFEYRKKVFKRKDINKVVVYATKPIGKVVGEFEIDEIIETDLDLLWQETKEYAGISKKFFDEYFEGRKSGFAIKIKNFRAYDVPVDLYEYNSNIKAAPQSFCYLEE